MRPAWVRDGAAAGLSLKLLRLLLPGATRAFLPFAAAQPRVHKGQTDRQLMSQGSRTRSQAMADTGLVVGAVDEG